MRRRFIQRKKSPDFPATVKHEFSFEEPHAGTINAGKIMNKLEAANMPPVLTGKPEKYIYLLIIAFWLSGALTSSYSVAYSSAIPLISEVLLALLASYLIGISLIVYQCVYRNIGLSLLFSILTFCVPLVVGVSWLFPIMATGFTYVAWCRRRVIGESIGRIGFAEVAAILIASSTFSLITLTSFHDADFLFLWEISHVQIGLGHDPLFHSALASMIKNYGIAGVGLNGLVTINYHIFSHILIAALSFGTGLPVVDSYGAFQLLVSQPLLLMFIVAAAETFRPSTKTHIFFIRIAVLFIALHLTRAWPIFAQVGAWDSYSTSESYALSLSLMLATICTAKIVRENYRLFALITLALLATASKVSTGTICLALMVTHLVFFDPGTRIKRILAGIILTTGWLALLYMEGLKTRIPLLLAIFDTGTILKFVLIFIVVATMAVGGVLLLGQRKPPRKYAISAASICAISFATYLWLHPLPFMLGAIPTLSFLHSFAGLPDYSSTTAFWKALGKFSLVHFLFTWLLVVLATNLLLFNRNEARYLRAPLAYNLIALGIGWLVLIFANFGHGNEFYFSNVTMFIALPFLLATLSEPVICRIRLQTIAANIIPLIVLIGSISVVVAMEHTKSWDEFMNWSSSSIRNALKGRQQIALNKITPSPWPYNPKFAQIISHLAEIRRDSSTKNLSVYIAKDVRDFWDMRSCIVIPFLIPAVSERPGLFALPDPYACGMVDGYGYGDYTFAEYKPSMLPRVAHTTLIKTAREAGMDGYIDVKTDGWTVYRVDAAAN